MQELARNLLREELNWALIICWRDFSAVRVDIRVDITVVITVVITTHTMKERIGTTTILMKA